MSLHTYSSGFRSPPGWLRKREGSNSQRQTASLRDAASPNLLERQKPRPFPCCCWQRFRDRSKKLSSVPLPRYPALTQLLKAKPGPSQGRQSRFSLSCEKNPVLHSQRSPCLLRSLSVQDAGAGCPPMARTMAGWELTALGISAKTPEAHLCGLSGTSPAAAAAAMGAQGLLSPAQLTLASWRQAQPWRWTEEPGEETPLFIRESHAPTQATGFRLQQSHLSSRA